MSASGGGGAESGGASLLEQAASGRAAAIAIQRMSIFRLPFKKPSAGAARIAHRTGGGTLAFVAADERLAAVGEVEPHPPIPFLALAAEFIVGDDAARVAFRSEEHTSELQSLMRISYAVFCLTKNKQQLK